MLALLAMPLACSSEQPSQIDDSPGASADASEAGAPAGGEQGATTAADSASNNADMTGGGRFGTATQAGAAAGSDTEMVAMASGGGAGADSTSPGQTGGGGTGADMPRSAAGGMSGGGASAGQSSVGGQATGGGVSAGGQANAESDDAGDEAASVAANIAYVAGNSNNTSDPGDAIGDVFLITRLEESLGHSVTLLADSLPTSELLAEADSADLVIVAESTTSVTLSDKLRATTTAVLCFEAFIQDEMGMTDSGPPGDPGLPAEFALGVKENETDIDIVDADHALAAGLSGTVTVYSEPRSITWGIVGPTAQVVATLPGDPAGASIYVYAAGAALFDGTDAAGTRIGYFLEDDNVTGTPNLMTQQGLELFDAAVAWALSP